MDIKFSDAHKTSKKVFGKSMCVVHWSSPQACNYEPWYLSR